VLTGSSWRHKDFQDRYKGHFASYVQRKIDDIMPSSQEGEGEGGGGRGWWYDSRVVLCHRGEDCSSGKGFFALDDIPQGDVVMKLPTTTTTTTTTTIASGMEKQSSSSSYYYYYHYMGHSTKPNCGIIDDKESVVGGEGGGEHVNGGVVVVALCPIMKDTELTIDHTIHTNIFNQSNSTTTPIRIDGSSSSSSSSSSSNSNGSTPTTTTTTMRCCHPGAGTCVGRGGVQQNRKE